MTRRRIVALGLLVVALASSSTTPMSARAASAAPTPSVGAAPDFAITKTVVVSGSTATFTINARNLTPATNGSATIVVVDRLPAGLSYVGFSGVDWACSLSAGPLPAGMTGPAIVCLSLSLNGVFSYNNSVFSGIAAPLTITATVAPGAMGTVANCASVYPNLGFVADPVVANNSSCVLVAPPSSATGRLCVAKWNDRDADGAKSPSEPYLAGWSFALTNTTTATASTLKTKKAARECAKVRVGLYTVAEVLQPGWRQTSPATALPQTVVVVAGQTASVSFGNTREDCCVTATFEGGRADDFVTSDGPEVAASTTGSSVPVTAFDVVPSGSGFRYRIDLPEEHCIAAARLEIRLKATTAAPTGGVVLLRTPGAGAGGGWNGAVWSRNLNTLSTAANPPYPWIGAKPARTYVWNLGALSSTNNPGAPLLGFLAQNRVLETSVTGGSKVDFLRLVVTFCECAP